MNESLINRALHKSYLNQICHTLCESNILFHSPNILSNGGGETPPPPLVPPQGQGGGGPSRL